MISLLLYLYIFFASWTAFYIFNPWFQIHVILLTISFLLSLPRILSDCKFPRNIYHFEDLLILIGIMVIAISSILNPNEKNMNYLMAYIYIFGIGYLGLKYLLYKTIPVKRIFDINSIAVLFIACFTILDVMSYSVAGIAIRKYLPLYTNVVRGYYGVIPRGYGLANEPGTLAFYYNTLGILALWRLCYTDYIRNYFLKIFLIILLILSWLSTYSAAGIAFMIISVFIVLVIKGISIKKCNQLSKNQKIVPVTIENSSMLFFYKPHRYSWKPLLILLLVPLVLFLVMENYTFVINTFHPIIEKVTLQSSSDSAEIRMYHWKYAINNMFDEPFWGKGIGYLSSIGRGSSHNWYFFVALEAGFIAAACFVFFFILTFIRIIKSKIVMKYWFMIAFIAGILNFTTSSTIFNPFLWILISLFNVVSAKQEECGDMEYQLDM